MIGNSQELRLYVTAPSRHHHSRLPGVRNSPTLPFEAKNSTGHLFDTVDCHVGTSSWGFSSARDHNHIERNQRRQMHPHMWRRKVVLVLCQAAVLSSTRTTRNFPRCPDFSVESGRILMWEGENPHNLVSWARLRRVAELRASAVWLHHRHLPADPALNRYVVTCTRQDPVCCPSRLPRLPLPVFIVCQHKLLKINCDSILSNGFTITVLVKFNCRHLSPYPLSRCKYRLATCCNSSIISVAGILILLF